MPGFVARVRAVLAQSREGLSQRGVAGMLGQAALRVRERVSLHEEHYWYELRLALLPDLPPLEPPLRFVVASGVELALFAELGQNVATARRRVEAGETPLLVLDGEQPAFGCWIISTEIPTPAAPKGKLTLPDGSVCLEDSVTHPQQRGRGLTVKALIAIVAYLREIGVQSMITKVPCENTAARKAALGNGFQEIARVQLDRIGPRRRVAVEVLNDAPTGAYLARRLSH
jgi:GNAT superfamily N-acetyltransferase